MIYGCMINIFSSDYIPLRFCLDAEGLVLREMAVLVGESEAQASF